MFPMAFGKEIEDARRAKNISQEALAELLGVSRVTINAWEKEHAAPTKKFWDNIATVLGVRLSLQAHEHRTPYDLDSDKYTYIRRLDVEASAGNGHKTDHEEIAGLHAYRRDWLDKKRLSAAACAVIEARGDSMQPSFFDGDALLVNTAQRRVISGSVFAFRTPDGVRVKRLFRLLDGRVRVVSDNPDKIQYPDEMLTPEIEAEIIGQVVHRSGDV